MNMKAESNDAPTGQGTAKMARKPIEVKTEDPPSQLSEVINPVNTLILDF